MTTTASRSASWDTLLHNRWTTLALFTLLTMTCHIDRFVLGALITPIKGEFHITDEQLGRLNLIFVFAYVAIVPIAGYVGDRLPRKWFIFVSLVVWSLASLGSGLALAFGSLLLWRAVVGVGEGVYSSLMPSWIADTFGPNLRSIAFAVIMSTGQVGAWVAYAGGGWIAATSSWHKAFFVAGVPGLILALAVIFLREPRRGGADGYAHVDIEKPTRREIGALFRSPDYLLYLGAYFFRMLGVGGIFFWGAVYLHRQYGITNQAATAFIGGAYFFAGTPGIFLAGIVAGRIARRFRGVFAFWLTASETLSATCVIIVLLFVHDIDTARWLLLGQMFFAGNSWGSINPVLFEFAPIRTRSLAVSTGLAMSTIGSSLLGAELVGIASDHLGIGHALLLAPAGYLVAAALWFILGLRQSRLKVTAPEKPQAEIEAAVLESQAV